MIQNPHENPLLIGLSNLLGYAGLGYLLMGQKKKALLSVLIFFIGGLVTCGLLCFFAWVTAYDSYQLAIRLQNGESIGENENALPFLDHIFKD